MPKSKKWRPPWAWLTSLLGIGKGAAGGAAASGATSGATAAGGAAASGATSGATAAGAGGGIGAGGLGVGGTATGGAMRGLSLDLGGATVGRGAVGPGFQRGISIGTDALPPQGVSGAPIQTTGGGARTPGITASPVAGAPIQSTQPGVQGGTSQMGDMTQKQGFSGYGQLAGTMRAFGNPQGNAARSAAAKSAMQNTQMSLNAPRTAAPPASAAIQYPQVRPVTPRPRKTEAEKAEEDEQFAWQQMMSDVEKRRPVLEGRIARGQPGERVVPPSVRIPAAATTPRTPRNLGNQLPWWYLFSGARRRGM